MLALWHALVTPPELEVHRRDPEGRGQLPTRPWRQSRRTSRQRGASRISVSSTRSPRRAPEGDKQDQGSATWTLAWGCIGESGLRLKLLVHFIAMECRALWVVTLIIVLGQSLKFLPSEGFGQRAKRKISLSLALASEVSGERGCKLEFVCSPDRATPAPEHTLPSSLRSSDLGKASPSFLLWSLSAPPSTSSRPRAASLPRWLPHTWLAMPRIPIASPRRKGWQHWTRVRGMCGRGLPGFESPTCEGLA